MGAPFRPAIARPRREEALAVIIESIMRGASPSYGEIGRAMHPRVSKSRVRQYVDELAKLGVIERDPASQRGIRVRDLVACRALIDKALGASGWHHASPLGKLVAPDPCTSVQGVLSPPFRYLPDIE